MSASYTYYWDSTGVIDSTETLSLDETFTLEETAHGFIFEDAFGEFDEINVSIDPGIATAVVQSIPPAYALGINLNIPQAEAQSEAFAPDFILDINLLLPVAEATAGGIVPTLNLDTNLLIGIATAVAEAIKPSIGTNYQEIIVPTAEAEAEAYALKKFTLDINLLPPAATATGQAYTVVITRSIFGQALIRGKQSTTSLSGSATVITLRGRRRTVSLEGTLTSEK